jgi:hypothetical protein
MGKHDVQSRRPLGCGPDRTTTDKSETCMSDVGTAVPKSQPAQAAVSGDTVQNRIAELKVSGHLMTLDTGLFCIFQAPGPPSANDRSGLPGVRISPPPGPAGRPDSVTISTFREDGWMNSSDAAALVRVTEGPAQILVTVYQAPSAPPEAAPRLQVMRLGGDGSGEMRVPPAFANAGGAAGEAAGSDIVVHVARAGDVPGRTGEWVGTRGSRQWIEGFSVTPSDGVAPADIEYQAVLGRGWMSPWIDGGKFCGSRGMALPLLGLKIRLKGGAAETHECSYAATFVDGSSVGPVPGGETCEAESLAALEAFQIVIRRRRREAARGTGRARASERTAPAAPPATQRSGRPTGRRSR